MPRLAALRILKDWFDRNPVDFGIVQCRFYILSWLGCRFFSRYKVPFIQIEHGAGEVIMPNRLMKFCWDIYDRTLNRWEKRIPHDYYAVSEAGLRWLEHYGIRGTGVISNSVDPRDFRQALETPGEWRKAHGIPDNKLMITFTGRLMREKGVVDLLEAFDRLKGEDLMLVIAGDGDRKLVSSWSGRTDILFTGQLPFSGIPSLLADTDIFCLPSHFIEGKPTGVLEAGYCGNAVVASGGGGTSEIIPDERYGKLVPAGNVSALTEALQDLLDHPEKRAIMGKNLHERVTALFTWKTAAEAVRNGMKKCGL